MNILRELVEASKQKNQKTYSPKTRLPTQEKTKKHKCSQCQRNDAKKLVFGNEVRWLCVVCIKKHNNRRESEKVNFVKASNLYRIKKESVE